MTEFITITALGGSQNRAGYLSLTVHVRKRSNEMGGILALSLAGIVTHLTEGLLGSRREYFLVVVGLVGHL
jgi:hypothetical protein